MAIDPFALQYPLYIQKLAEAGVSVPNQEAFLAGVKEEGWENLIFWAAKNRGTGVRDQDVFCEFAAAVGQIPVTMRSTSPSGGSIEPYTAYLRANEISKEEFNESYPWLPVGMVGMVLVLGHYFPYAEESLGLPTDRCGFVQIRRNDYMGLLASVREQVDILIEEPGFNDDSLFPDMPFARLIEDGESSIDDMLEYIMAHFPINEQDAQAIRAVTGKGITKISELPRGIRETMMVYKMRCRPVPIEVAKVDNQFVGDMQADLLAGFSAVPFSEGHNTIWFAMPDPTNLVFGDRYSASATSEDYPSFVPCIAAERTCTSVLDSIQGGSVSTDENIKFLEGKKKTNFIVDPIACANIKIEARKTEETEIINWLLDMAMKSNVSDVHIEEYKHQTSLRLTIDGVPRQVARMPINRLKRMDVIIRNFAGIPYGGYDHGEGRFSFGYQGRTIDARVSMLMCDSGFPKYTIRLLDSAGSIQTLSDLGISADQMDIFQSLIRRKYGVILISGPTGSGKSTTMFSALNVLNDRDKIIYTIEDPVEYHIPGVYSCPARGDTVEDRNWSITDTIRRFLRAAPRIITVGEVRDAATASACMDAGNTGHLVLGSIHCNNAMAIISRLIKLNVDPFLISEALVGVQSQRLIRRLCSCKRPVRIDKRLRKLYSGYGYEISEDKKVIYEPVGCPECNGTGYRGRLAIFEIMALSEEIKDMIGERAPVSQVRAQARTDGFRDLLYQGLHKTLFGVTSFEEVVSECRA